MHFICDLLGNYLIFIGNNHDKLRAAKAFQHPVKSSRIAPYGDKGIQQTCPALHERGGTDNNHNIDQKNHPPGRQAAKFARQ